MIIKSKLAKILSLSCIIAGVTCFLGWRNTQTAFSSKALNDNYTLSLTSYDGGSSKTFVTTEGNDIEFSFYECYKVTYGFLRVSSGATIRNVTPIHGIKSITINADNYPEESFLEYNIFLNGISKAKYTYGRPNNAYNVSVDNDAFSVTFDDEYIIKSLVIEYSCI